MSLGADDILVYKMFMFEALLLGVLGGVLGSGLGVLASVVLGPAMLATATGLGNIPGFVIPLSIGVSTTACLVASLYPTWRATKIDPVSALKAI